MQDAYVCDGVRTPIGRYGGGLASIRPDNLLSLTIRKVLDRNPGVDPVAIDDCFMGCANQAGEDNRNVARMSVLLAGLPESVPGVTINRLCGSGLEAVGQAARAIQIGAADLVLAGGVESMSRAPMVISKSPKAYSRDVNLYDTTIGWRFVNPEMETTYGVDGLPLTAENVAEEHNISREDQDKFAFGSQAKTRAAKDSGFFEDEIVPVSIPQGRCDPVIFSEDEHPRPESTLEGLSKLSTPFKSGGTVTAGNASGVNDGAASLLLASTNAIEKHGLQPLVRVIGMRSTGVHPRVMGMGPVPATQLLLDSLGLKLPQMDVIEINEAFASQSLAVLRALALPDDAEHVNPNGGAIAIGHPLGMSGARIALVAARELVRRKGRYALCTMCIGVGQGIALVMERMSW
ncbi:MAG: 3-oxoadipyl-CoA thiolase [Hyphomonadaceae bacterium]|nr:3-oxoadipyl-CoA thiolase [Hyphomonadaceae bacterium]MBC6412065.1 3-oxoadipyl-CoA thiolase [Hyphomonadaceae bacterium]